MDDGWTALAIVLVLAGALLLQEWLDKRAGKYPRDWRD